MEKQERERERDSSDTSIFQNNDEGKEGRKEGKARSREREEAVMA